MDPDQGIRQLLPKEFTQISTVRPSPIPRYCRFNFIPLTVPAVIASFCDRKQLEMFKCLHLVANCTTYAANVGPQWPPYLTGGLRVCDEARMRHRLTIRSILQEGSVDIWKISNRQRIFVETTKRLPLPAVKSPLTCFHMKIQCQQVGLCI